MSNKEPLLSIAIPTKNRQYYCIEAIKHILSYDEEDFELVVQDNSDDTQVQEFVNSIDDKRLKYSYTNEAISSVENMNRSIEKTNGEYVCMIGDDDTVLPEIFEYASYMKENDLDSICAKYNPAYIWPSKISNGSLTVIRCKYEKPIKKVSLRKDLKVLAQNGIIDYQQYFLPRLYHGLIKKTILNKIHNKIGAYISGLSPDIYLTVALSTLVSNHLIINEPLTIAGACPSSSTAQNTDGGHRGELEEAPHLQNRGDYQWDELVPRYYSVETIWAETALTAARDFDIPEIYEHFNIVLFNIISFMHNKSISHIVIREIKVLRNQNGIKFNLLKNSYMTIKYFLLNNSQRLLKKIFLKKIFQYNNIKNIKDSVSKIQDRMK